MPASADPLTDQRDRVNGQIAQTQDDLDDSNAALDAATTAVRTDRRGLDAARAALAQTERELAAAKARDVAMAAKLKQAKLDLDKAGPASQKVSGCSTRSRRRRPTCVRYQYQQQTNLLADRGPHRRLDGRCGHRLQWSTTLFDTAASQLDRLQDAEEQLVAKRAKQTELEAEVAAQRKAAAENLALKRDAAGEGGRPGSRRGRSAGAAADRPAGRGPRGRAGQDPVCRPGQGTGLCRAPDRGPDRQGEGGGGRARGAREAAEPPQGGRGPQGSQRRPGGARRTAARTPQLRRVEFWRVELRWVNLGRFVGWRLVSGGGGGNHGFIYPVSAPITSPYGMRFHPVLHVWKLHDGTDFGAGCGTAIHAAYSGRVAERYYNAATATG